MEPSSLLPAKAPSNEPHNLLARLYREIGVSAVAAALQVPEVDAIEPRGADAGTGAVLIAARPADKAA